MHTISSYHGNRPTNKPTNKHKQTGPITNTAPLSLALSVINVQCTAEIIGNRRMNN